MLGLVCLILLMACGMEGRHRVAESVSEEFFVNHCYEYVLVLRRRHCIMALGCTQ